jgi:hypothetical protein
VLSVQFDARLVPQENTHTVDGRAGLVVEIEQFEFTHQGFIVDSIKLSRNMQDVEIVLLAELGKQALDIQRVVTEDVNSWGLISASSGLIKLISVGKAFRNEVQ